MSDEEREREHERLIEERIGAWPVAKPWVYVNKQDECDHSKHACWPIPASPAWRWACMGCRYIYPDEPLPLSDTP